MFRKNWLRGLVFAAVVPCLCSCGDGENEVKRHLLPSEAKEPSLSAEAQRVRDMQKVQFKYHTFSTDKDEWFDAEPHELSYLKAQPLCKAAYTGSSNCVKAVYAKRMQLCVAEFLLKASQERANPVILEGQWSDANFLEVLPQSHATNVGMLREALDYAILAVNQKIGASTMGTWGSVLTPSVVASCTGSTNVDGDLTGDGLYQPNPLKSDILPEVTLAEMTRETIVRAYEVGKQAAALGVENILAVADAERSSTPSTTVASRRGWMQPSLSRLAAAQLLVGGSNPPGYLENPDLTRPADFPFGFCPEKPLSAQAQRAVDLFRAAAPPPSWLTDASLSTAKILNGPLQSLEGSVRERLADAVKDSALNSTTTDLCQYYGLSITDFDEARQYLVDEMKAFARDLDQSREPVAGTKFPHYTALSVPAHDAPSAFYVALAVGQGDAPLSALDAKDPGVLSLSSFRELARQIATGFLEHPPALGLSDVQVKEFLQTGALLEQKVNTDVPGRITLGHSLDFAHIDYAAYVAPPNCPSCTIQLIEGEAALKCAIEGNIEGSSCATVPTRAQFVEYNLTGGSTPEGCSGAARCWGTTLTGDLREWLRGKPRVYIVQGNVSQPGSFTLLGAAELRGPGNASTQIPAYSVDYDEVAKIMRPSKQWCNQPRKPCSGASFDERLPLEDELSSDNDGVESSWKHYLALAKQATQESDALGQAFVDASLKVDENKFSESIRLEQQRQSLNAALEKLQDTCGTAIDAEKFVSLFVDGPQSQCTSTLECQGSNQICTAGRCSRGIRQCSDTISCPSDGVCMNGVCTPDLQNLLRAAKNKADPDLQRIANCLQGNTYKFVSLGDAPLCVKQVPGHVGYCESGGLDCPRLATVEKPCDPSSEVEVHRDTPSATDHSTHQLELFRTTISTDDPQEACDAIASVRNGGISYVERLTFFETIKNSRVFLPEIVSDIAQRLGFEARLGSFSAVTLGGMAIYNTGNPASGPNYGQWPCAADGQGVTLNPSKALRSQQTDCSNNNNADQRALMNDRLMRAVILARFVGNNPFGEGLLLPGVSIDVDPKATVGNAVTLKDQGSINRVDMKITPTKVGGEKSAQVFTTTDQPSSSMVAYRTFVNNALTNVKVLDLYNGKKQYFTLANFTGDREELAWLQEWETLGGVAAPTVKAGRDKRWYAWMNIMEPTDPGNTARLRQTFGGKMPELSLGQPEKTYFQSFPLVNVEKWFAGLSTQIPPAVSASPAYGYFAALLGVDGAPAPLPGFIYHPEHFLQGHGMYDRVTFAQNNMLDALELICLARSIDKNGLKPDMNHPPSVSSPDDIPIVKAYLDETARRIEDWASRFVLPNFPKEAADFVRAQSRSGVVPALGGSYAKAMTNLRASLVEIGQVAPLMAYELRQMGTAVTQARIAAAETDLTSQLNQLNFESTIANSTAACVGSMVSSEAKATFGASAAVICANAIVQSVIAAKQLKIGNDVQNLEKAAALNTFQEQLNTHAQAIQSYAARISKSLEELDGNIAEIERQRLGAQRALTEAIQIAAFTPSNAENISATLVRQSKTAEVRYTRAFENAKRMAYLAKRSIEQRLGILLADMHEDLPLVDAPNSWESTVCDRSGIDWQKVRANNDDVPENYADAFLGEYVDKLERVVESYRMENSFHEGSDTAVVSLRDDVLNVRAPCSTQTMNLLEHSADLGALADAEGRHGWTATGCIPRVNPETGETVAPQNCVSVTPAEGAVTIQRFAQSGLEPTVRSMATDTGGFRVFNMVNGKPNGSACGTNECDYSSAAAWTQKVTLDAGTYRLSYFNRQDGPGQIRAKVFAQQNNLLGSPHTDGSFVVLVGNGALGSGIWGRQFYIFSLPASGDVSVQLSMYDAWGVGVTSGPVAAPMLERIDSIGGLSDAELRPISVVSTGSSQSLTLKSCEDTEGTYFRANGWRRGEVPLCPDGFGGNCDKSQAKMHGYWEIPFSINQRDIESGRILKKAGFALGNFNYRIESIGLNFVGTGIRNCSGSDTPSTCYSGGFVPYSLDHIGPYNVRNHFGGNFEAKLFTGHIETARGLAAERYLTNPLSSADDQLLKDYLRAELQGRPLDGNFVIRIWDNPDVDFNAIRDIQVVLKYRYWTRFN
jgi:hypothetical protein